MPHARSSATRGGGPREWGGSRAAPGHVPVVPGRADPPARGPFSLVPPTGGCPTRCWPSRPRSRWLRPGVALAPPRSRARSAHGRVGCAWFRFRQRSRAPARAWWCPITGARRMTYILLPDALEGTGGTACGKRLFGAGGVDTAALGAVDTAAFGAVHAAGLWCRPRGGPLVQSTPRPLAERTYPYSGVCPWSEPPGFASIHATGAATPSRVVECRTSGCVGCRMQPWVRRSAGPPRPAVEGRRVSYFWLRRVSDATVGTTFGGECCRPRAPTAQRRCPPLTSARGCPPAVVLVSAGGRDPPRRWPSVVLLPASGVAWNRRYDGRRGPPRSQRTHTHRRAGSTDAT